MMRGEEGEGQWTYFVRLLQLLLSRKALSNCGNDNLARLLQRMIKHKAVDVEHSKD
jgi:hypothetical protein